MNGQAARTFLEELRQRKAQVIRELTELETLEAGVVGYLGSLLSNVAIMPMDQRKPVISAAPFITTQCPASLWRKADTPPRPKWRETISDVFRDYGPSLTVVQIREAVRKLGYCEGASDSSLYKSVYTALTRNTDVFENRDRLWWLISGRP
jgi:hypothetical protein